MEENKAVVEIYLRVQNQHIMGFNGPVDLNLLSLKLVMDMMGTKDRTIFERVHNLYRTMLSSMRSDTKAQG